MNLQKLETLINNHARADMAEIGSVNSNGIKRLLHTIGRSPGKDGVQFLKSIDHPPSTRFPYRLIPANDLYPPIDQRNTQLSRGTLQEGLEKIRQDIGTYDQEHGWIHIPAEQLWIDDTWCASKDTTAGDPYLRKYLSVIFPELYLIHTHPDKTMKGLYEKGERTWQYTLEAATPTSADLVSLTQQQAYADSSCKLIGGIISHFGFTTYSQTETNLKLRGGARCANYVGEGLDFASSPAAAIRNILGKQSQLCSRIQYRDHHEPAFEFAFTPYKRFAKGRSVHDELEYLSLSRQSERV